MNIKVGKNDTYSRNFSPCHHLLTELFYVALELNFFLPFSSLYNLFPTQHPNWSLLTCNWTMSFCLVATATQNLIQIPCPALQSQQALTLACLSNPFTLPCLDPQLRADWATQPDWDAPSAGLCQALSVFRLLTFALQPDLKCAFLYFAHTWLLVLSLSQNVISWERSLIISPK